MKRLLVVKSFEIRLSGFVKVAWAVKTKLFFYGLILLSFHNTN